MRAVSSRPLPGAVDGRLRSGTASRCGQIRVLLPLLMFALIVLALCSTRIPSRQHDGLHASGNAAAFGAGVRPVGLGSMSDPEVAQSLHSTKRDRVFFSAGGAATHSPPTAEGQAAASALGAGMAARADGASRHAVGQKRPAVAAGTPGDAHAANTRDAAHAASSPDDWCASTAVSHAVRAGNSWGSLPAAGQKEWAWRRCDVIVRRTARHVEQNSMANYTAQLRAAVHAREPSRRLAKRAPSPPVFAVCVSSTSRGTGARSLDDLALFSVMLPSLRESILAEQAAAHPTDPLSSSSNSSTVDSSSNRSVPFEFWVYVAYDAGDASSPSSSS